jgi:hypothetical protein
LKKPQRITTVRTETVDDGLGVHSWQTGKTYVLNATTALVWQHCDGQTTPQQLVELLQRQFDLPREHAEGVMRLALDELGEAHLLQAAEARPAGPSRRDLFRSMATAGLSLVLIPVVTAVTASADDDHGHHHRDDDDHDRDHDHDHDHHTTTTTPPPTTTTIAPTTTTAPPTSTTTLTPL